MTKKTLRKHKVNGKKLSPKKSVQERLLIGQKQTSEEIKELRVQLNRIMLETGKNLGVLNERSMLGWEFFWGLVKLLEDKNLVAPADLDVAVKAVKSTWKVEGLKDKLAETQCLCESCATVQEAEAFLNVEEGGFKCPNCGSLNVPYSKPESEEKSDDVVQSNDSVS